MYVYVAIAIFAALSASFGTWKVQDWRYAAKDKERLEAQAEKRRMDAKQIDAAAVGHEADKRQIQAEFVTITQEVEHVVEKPVYRDECLDADGLRVLTSAIRPAQPASQPAGTVPRPSPTR